mgnify:CR=1 FL=1
MTEQEWQAIGSSRDCPRCDGGRIIIREGVCKVCNGLGGVVKSPGQGVHKVDGQHDKAKKP